MVSFYYYVQFRDLKIKDYSNPKEGCCSICKNNYMKTCECCYASGNTSLPDMFNPTKKLLVMRGQMIKRADYYDKTVTDLLSWNRELKEDVIDIKQYRQW